MSDSTISLPEFPIQHICKTCGKLRLDDYYYRNRQGRRDKTCKECKRLYAVEYRRANQEKCRAYEQKRSVDKESILERQRRAKDRNPEKARTRRRLYNQANPDKAKRWRRENEERYPEKSAARRAVKDAINAGILKRQDCQVCGTAKGVQAHHDDYAKPLDVVWLCPEHHGQRHRMLNDQRRAEQNKVGNLIP